MALVVKKWFADASQNSNGEYVHIYARRNGFFSWLLSLMRLDPTVYFGVFLDQVEFRVSSLSGYIKKTAPVSSIASCSYGYSKPWKMCLFILILFTMLALSIAKLSLIGGLSTLVVGIFITVIYFILKRSLSFSVTLHSGEEYGMTVKRSIIENKEIDEKSFEHVVAIITSVIRTEKRGNQL